MKNIPRESVSDVFIYILWPNHVKTFKKMLSNILSTSLKIPVVSFVGYWDAEYAAQLLTIILLFRN